MKLYYVRHGLTQWNIDGYMQGHSDIPLCDKGRKQAQQTAEMLSDKHIDLCIASPLTRTRETAEIILGAREVPIIFDERIMERNFGSIEGTTYFQDATDETKAKMWDIAEDGNFGDIETMASLVKRVYDFLDEIKEKYKNKSVLVVSHGGLSSAVKYYIRGQSISGDYNSDIIKNCEIIEGEI